MPFFFSVFVTLCDFQTLGITRRRWAQNWMYVKWTVWRVKRWAKWKSAWICRTCGREKRKRRKKRGGEEGRIYSRSWVGQFTSTNTWISRFTKDREVEGNLLTLLKLNVTCVQVLNFQGNEDCLWSTPLNTIPPKLQHLECQRVSLLVAIAAYNKIPFPRSWSV